MILPLARPEAEFVSAYSAPIANFIRSFSPYVAWAVAIQTNAIS